MVSQWAELMGGKLRWDALSSRIDVLFFFYSKEVISPDFWYVSLWCTATTFSITVTSPASDRWHSSSQEELREHIHLRPSSSRTTSTDITPPPPPPFNLSTLSHILRALSWFFSSPRCVSWLRLWWNISLSLCHSCSASAAHGRKATRQWTRILTLNSVYSTFAEEWNICWFSF